MIHKTINNRGFSLIEILIASSILTFGILNIANLRHHSLKRTTNAYQHAFATSQWISTKDMPQ